MIGNCPCRVYAARIDTLGLLIRRAQFQFHLYFINKTSLLFVPTLTGHNATNTTFIPPFGHHSSLFCCCYLNRQNDCGRGGRLYPFHLMPLETAPKKSRFPKHLASN